MKTLVSCALILLAPSLAWSQSASAQPPKAAAKAQAKKAAPAKASEAKATAAKASAGKTSKPAKVVAKAAPSSSRTQLHSGAMQVASGIAAAEAALTPEQLAISERVHTGHIACELGASVDVVADTQTPGRFHIQGKGFKYYMTPVTTSTGAVRLEDERAGAVWIQIANKSMLMNQKLGQRMADECMSAQQFTVAEAIKKNPQQSLLEGDGSR